jgi:hypothetical protein
MQPLLADRDDEVHHARYDRLHRHVAPRLPAAAMVRVDITCDLMDEDETGHVWAFLREARDQALI